MTSNSAKLFCMVWAIQFATVGGSLGFCLEALPRSLSNKQKAYIANYAQGLQFSSLLSSRIEAHSVWSTSDAAALHVYFELLRGKTKDVTQGACAADPQLNGSGVIVSVFSKSLGAAAFCEGAVLGLLAHIASVTSERDFETAKRIAAISFLGDSRVRRMIASLYASGSIYRATLDLTQSEFASLASVQVLKMSFPSTTPLPCDRSAIRHFFGESERSTSNRIRDPMHIQQFDRGVKVFALVRQPLSFSTDPIGEALHSRLCGPSLWIAMAMCKIESLGMTTWIIAPLGRELLNGVDEKLLIAEMAANLGGDSKSYLDENLRVAGSPE